MGIFDKIREIKENRYKKRLEKCRRTIKNPKAVKDDRMAALQYLAELDDMEAAVPVLLTRFDYSLENGIIDTREKEVALEGVIRWEEKARPLVTEHLKQTTRIAWPIKILNKVAKPEDVASSLLETLNFEAASFDQAAIDKNYDILCYLRDFKIGENCGRLSVFLQDSDERVRFACAETLIEQGDDTVAAQLEPFLVDESSENRRIRKVVLDAFVNRHWKVKDPSRFQHELVAEGIFFNKKSNTLTQRA